MNTVVREDRARDYHRTTPHKKITLPAALAYLAGTVFTVASAATNLVYGIAKGVTLPEMMVWGGVAVAASLALAIAPTAIVSSLQRRAFGSATLALVAASIFGAFSIMAALGSATGGRLVAISEASDAAHTRRIAMETYASTKTELDSLQPSRPAGEIESAITTILASDGRLSSGGDCSATWLANNQLRAKCIDVNKLRAELARAEQRSDLVAKIDKASNTLASPLVSSKKTMANKDAIAIQGFAAAFGLTASLDTINRLLVVLAVLVIELGGGLAFALAGSLKTSGSPPEAPETQRAKALVSEPTQTPVQPNPTASAPSVSSEPERLMIADDTSERLVQLLRERGGRVFGGQRMIARALNTSPASLNRMLQQLSEAGRVVVKAGSRGTVVRLVATP